MCPLKSLFTFHHTFFIFITVRRSPLSFKTANAVLTPFTYTPPRAPHLVSPGRLRPSFCIRARDSRGSVMAHWSYKPLSFHHSRRDVSFIPEGVWSSENPFEGILDYNVSRYRAGLKIRRASSQSQLLNKIISKSFATILRLRVYILPCQLG